MDCLARRARIVAFAALLGAAAPLSHAQGFTADYSLAPLASTSAETHVRLAPAFSFGGDVAGAGLSLQAGRNWFGQVGVSQAATNPLLHPGTTDVVNFAGGYRWSNGQSLSLQVSRGRGQGQRLGLAVNYDWPRYFVRFSYDPQGFTLSPQESLRFSAGVRF